MEHLTPNPAPTPESVWAQFQEIGRLQKENERIFNERLAKSERAFAKKMAKYERQRKEEERQRREEERQRREEERKRREEEEKQRREEERQRREEEERRREEEEKQRRDEERQRKAEEEKQRKEEEERRKEEERQRREEERQRREEERQRREEEEKQRKEEERQRKEEERQRKEDADLEWEQQRKKDKETLDRVSAQSDKYQKRIDDLGKYFGGLANSCGDMAEEYFFNTLRIDKTFAQEQFDDIIRNVIYPEDDNKPALECDIFMFNGKSAAFIEVKYKAKPDNINIDKLSERVFKFKTLFPEYKNHNIYLGVAAMSFKKGFAKQLRSAGVATIHQVGKKMVVYDKEVKVF